MAKESTGSGSASKVKASIDGWMGKGSSVYVYVKEKESTWGNGRKSYG